MFGGNNARHEDCDVKLNLKPFFGLWIGFHCLVRPQYGLEKWSQVAIFLPQMANLLKSSTSFNILPLSTSYYSSCSKEQERDEASSPCSLLLVCHTLALRQSQLHRELVTPLSHSAVKLFSATFLLTRNDDWQKY